VGERIPFRRATIWMPEVSELTRTETKPVAAEFHVEGLLLELNEQRETARRREAIMASVIAHLCLFILIILNPKIFVSHGKRVGPVDLLKQQNLTFLVSPYKTPKPPHPVHSPVLSDQDRLFHRQTPVLDSMSQPKSGPAPRPVAPPPAAPRPAAPLASNPNVPPAPRAAPPDTIAKKNSATNGIQLQDVPQVEEPKVRVPIGAMSARDQLQRAIQQAARDRADAGGSSSGIAMGRLPGKYGIPGSTGAGVGQVGNGYRILTDTQGVDFASYMARVIAVTKRNWYAVMPEVVYLGQKGRVIIRLRINRDGTVTNLDQLSGSGMQSLDTAAMASITSSNPYPPLPTQFNGPFIDLEFWYFYNLQPETAPQ
jgi:TonB family protein